MPKLSEVEKLSTTDSSGGRIKSSQSRRYMIANPVLHGKTRAQAKDMIDVSTILQELSGTNTANSNATEENRTNEKDLNFLDIPEDLLEGIDSNTDFVVSDTNTVGYRLLNVEKLEKVVSKNFCCVHCIERGVGTYLEDFVSFADKIAADYKQKGKKEVTTRQAYNQFVRDNLNKQKPSIKERIGVPVGIKQIRTTGFASEILFQCSCRNHFKNKNLRAHQTTMFADAVKNEPRGRHASYAINHFAVCAFQHIGCGPYHMQQVAAWLGHPWKTIADCFKQTEKNWCMEGIRCEEVNALCDIDRKELDNQTE